MHLAPYESSATMRQTVSDGVVFVDVIQLLVRLAYHENCTHFHLLQLLAGCCRAHDALAPTSSTIFCPMQILNDIDNHSDLIIQGPAVGTFRPEVRKPV